MSINHYSSLDLPETTLWWTQHQQHPQQQHQQHILMEPIPNPSWSLHHHHNQPTWFNSHNPTINTPRFNLNNEEDEEEQDHNTTTTTNNNEQTPTSQQEGGEEEQEEEEDKEPMFEKPLTPSDVGKLNRLVIPKQHAEKYFPLGASTAASDSGECKGLLLSFEDESGKCWRFRYSYWNSSQSYVLTKGWSRYVKDKRLDAGDVVSFERHRDDAQRLFIRWRRRSGAAVAAQVSRVGHGAGGGGDGNNGNGRSGGGVVGWTSGFYCAHPSNPTHHHHLAYQQQHDGLHAGSQGPNQRTRPVGNCSSSSSSSSSKVLRLFGVNMECQPQHDSGPSTPECSYNMPSTQGSDTHHFYHHHQPPSNYSSSNTHPHMVRQQPDYY